MRKELIVAILGIVVMAATASPGMAESSHKGHGGMHHGSKMHGGWKAALDASQREQVDRLHLQHKGQMYVLKARMKQAKIELALLEASDNPDTAAIDKKIDELVELKRQKLKQRAVHHIEIRKLLNEDQRLKFDMHLLNKAKKGHHGRHGK